MILPKSCGIQRPYRKCVHAHALAFHGLFDDDHLDEAEEVPRSVTYEEYQNDAHENDGQVVLLLPTSLLGCRGRSSWHWHLTAIPMLDVFVNLSKKKWNVGWVFTLLRSLSAVTVLPTLLYPCYVIDLLSKIEIFAYFDIITSLKSHKTEKWQHCLWNAFRK